jgi:hypothetical protein
MAIRTDFTAGEVLAAADLNDTFGAKLNLAGGKILQIVRATDSTDRTTTSTSFVDVTGMSVTITPQKSDSAVLLIASCVFNTTRPATTAPAGDLAITDASNNLISGAQRSRILYLDDAGNAGRTLIVPIIIVGYSTPATLSATTYKMRFNAVNVGATVTVNNADQTGQMYAIEVSA